MSQSPLPSSRASRTPPGLARVMPTQERRGGPASFFPICAYSSHLPCVPEGDLTPLVYISLFGQRVHGTCRTVLVGPFLFSFTRWRPRLLGPGVRSWAHHASLGRLVLPMPARANDPRYPFRVALRVTVR